MAIRDDGSPRGARASDLGGEDADSAAREVRPALPRIERDVEVSRRGPRRGERIRPSLGGGPEKVLGDRRLFPPVEIGEGPQRGDGVGVEPEVVSLPEGFVRARGAVHDMGILEQFARL